MGEKRIMRSFKLLEVSAVDRPAQAHAKKILMKRADAAPPNDVRKDMYDVSRFAELISSISYLMRSSTRERTEEGDNSQIPEKLQNWLGTGAVIFQAMAAEEINELIATSLTKREHESLGGTPDEAAAKAASGTAPKGDDPMNDTEKKAFDDLQKSLADATAQIAKLTTDAAVAKLDPKQGAHYAGLNDIEKAAFLALTDAERVAKVDAGTSPELKKALDQNEDLRKRLAAIEERDQIAAFAKRATDLGLPAEHGETLRKAYAGDAAAIAKHEAYLKAQKTQVDTGALFAEFGTTQGGDATSADGVLKAKADEYQKAQIALGKKCSPQQAFTAVYTSPDNVELKKRYDAEVVAKRARA